MSIDDFDIMILGFSGEIDSVGDVLSKINIGNDDSITQLMNADLIAGKNHVLHAINQSVLAFSRNENFANDLGVEICLRCSAQRQISKAFDLLGLKEGKMNLCAVLLNPNNEILDYLNNTFTRDDDVLLPVSADLIEAFDISKEQVDEYMYEDIIIDKISKLSADY